MFRGVKIASSRFLQLSHILVVLYILIPLGLLRAFCLCHQAQPFGHPLLSPHFSPNKRKSSGATCPRCFTFERACPHHSFRFTNHPVFPSFFRLCLDLVAATSFFRCFYTETYRSRCNIASLTKRKELTRDYFSFRRILPLSYTRAFLRIRLPDHTRSSQWVRMLLSLSLFPHRSFPTTALLPPGLGHDCLGQWRRRMQIPPIGCPDQLP